MKTLIASFCSQKKGVGALSVLSTGKQRNEDIVIMILLLV